MALGVSFGAILLFMLLRMPVTYSFLGGSLIYMALAGLSGGAVASAAFYSLDSTVLLSIPLFLLGGKLMEISGIAERLVDLAGRMTRRMKGGMGATIPIACMFFGALSGSGTAAVAALGSIMIPRMEKMGWKKSYTAALMAAAGPLGFMIPPNMTAILYGVMANTSIAALFVSTIIPGFIWCFLYLLINRVLYKRYYQPMEKRVDLQEEMLHKKKARESVPALGMAVLIIGGIYGGFFTATEAGAVSCVYAALVGILYYRTIHLKDLGGSLVASAKEIASILIIFPVVSIYTRFLVLEGVPQSVATAMLRLSDNRNVIIFLMVVIFVLAGMFLSSGVITLVLTPLMLPTARAIGMDPIQMGVILFVAVGLGSLTPPMAMNLFVAQRVAKISFREMIGPIMPFILFGALPILLLVAYVPQLSLWLPRILIG